MSEKQFRRGFQHGVESVIAFLESDKFISEQCGPQVAARLIALNKYSLKVALWRNENTDEIIPPPSVFDAIENHFSVDDGVMKNDWWKSSK